jgi:hypothetical protein
VAFQKKPRSAVRACLKTLESPPCRKQCLLHCVLGRVRVWGHTPRYTQQRRRMHQRDPFKLAFPIIPLCQSVCLSGAPTFYKAL